MNHVSQNVSSENCSLQALLEEVSRPLHQTQLEKLVQETFPEVRQIASASSHEERETVLKQLKNRLQEQKSQDSFVQVLV